MTITPVALQSEAITHFITISQDITERKQAEEALRAAEEKYRAIFEDAVVGIFQATPEGCLVNVNRAFAMMHGFESPEQLLGDKSGRACPQFIDSAQLAEWTQVLNNHGTVRSVEVEVRCRGRERKRVLADVRAARNGDGDIVLHKGTGEDITQRKLAQQQVNYLAYFDTLTGLANRTLLQKRLDSALASAALLGNGVVLLFLDLDRFKIINDSLGPTFGDLILQQVASRLKNQI